MPRYEARRSALRLTSRSFGARGPATAFQEVTSIDPFRQRPDASHPYSSEMRVSCCWRKVAVFFLFRLGFMIGLGAARETEPLFFLLLATSAGR